jgi:OOP family OmpA-OmpF porin
MASFRMPVGPFSDGNLPTQLTEGALDQTAYRVALAQLSTLELILPLRDQITKAGFEVMFECETDACGGFDFRYGTDVLPEPDMHVDLGDFRYLAARRLVAGAEEYVALLVSRSAQDGFVQLTRIGQVGKGLPVLQASTRSPDNEQGKKAGVFALAGPKPGRSVPELADLGKRLELGQSQVLEDLVFGPGSSALNKGEYTSLGALATWLKAEPKRQVTLVGHTDASGGLAGNINLSRLRAESVRQHILFAYGVTPGQILAEGVGYLAPRDTNQTEEGRQNNRRVEVIATSTELLAP